jgi:ABC-2 type transport system permease protein
VAEMNKFVHVFKKELRDVLSAATLIPLVLMLVLFYFMGNYFNDIMDSAPGGEASYDENGEIIIDTSPKNTIFLIDKDGTASSVEFVDILKGTGYNTIANNEITPENAFIEYKDQFSVVMVIPQGFSDNYAGSAGESANILLYSSIDSFSMLSAMNSTVISSIVGSIDAAISDALIQANLNSDAPPYDYLKNPISTTNFTRIGDNIEQIDPGGVISAVTMQTIFVPVIIFLIIIFSTQMLAASVTGEKADKTLETLLTTPVKRIYILIAKMLSASFVSLVYTVIFMFSMNNFTGEMTGMSLGSGSSDAQSKALEALGITFNTGTYIILGFSLFFSIVIGLAMAIIIGILSEDLKKLQGMMTPITILTMLPYFTTLLSDINEVPVILKGILYIIPFTHTYTAINNIFTDNYTMLAIGLVYQFIFLVASVAFAVNIFGTDKLFTLKLEFGKKKKKFSES